MQTTSTFPGARHANSFSHPQIELAVRCQLRALPIVVSALLLSTVLANAAELPKRKPGLWTITTVSPGLGMTTIDTCVGDNDNIALPSDSGDCSQPKVTPAGSEVIVDVVCTKPYGKEIMSTAFGGDFGSHYHGVMKMTFEPAEGTKNMGVTIDAKYIGPDCGPSGTKKDAD